MPRVHRVCFAVVAALLIAGLAPAEEWSRFRGPNGSGVAETTNLPVEFGPEKNLEWVADVDFARSSPVLTQDRVFLTAIDGESFITLAFDRASGQEIWRRVIGRERETAMHQATDSATPSPVTDGENVYAFFQETGLVSYDAAGETRWRMALGPFRNFYGIAASPVLAGNALVLLCDQNAGSFLLAVDKDSGKQLWRQDRPGRSLSYTTPILYPDQENPREILVLGDKWLDAYDPASGASRWFMAGLGAGPVSSPVLAGDLLFVNAPDQAPEPPPPFTELSGEHDADGNGLLTKQEVEGTWMIEHFGFVDWDGDGMLSADDWKELNRSMETDSWGIHAIRLPAPETESKIVWTSQQSVPYIPTGLFHDGVLYMVKDGIVSSFDAETGDLHKRGRLTKGSPKIYASPVVADGKIFMGLLDGQMAVVKAGPEWEVLALNDLGDEIYATPAIADGHLYVRTRGKLFSFALADTTPSAVSP